MTCEGEGCYARAYDHEVRRGTARRDPGQRREEGSRTGADLMMGGFRWASVAWACVSCVSGLGGERGSAGSGTAQEPKQLSSALCPSSSTSPRPSLAMASSLYGGIAFKNKDAAPPVLPAAATPDASSSTSLSQSLSPAPVPAATVPEKDPKGT